MRPLPRSLPGTVRTTGEQVFAGTKNAPGAETPDALKFIPRLRDAAYSSSSESSWNLLMMSFMTFGGTVS